MGNTNNKFSNNKQLVDNGAKFRPWNGAINYLFGENSENENNNNTYRKKNYDNNSKNEKKKINNFFQNMDFNWKNNNSNHSKYNFRDRNELQKKNKKWKRKKRSLTIMKNDHTDDSNLSDNYNKKNQKLNTQIQSSSENEIIMKDKNTRGKGELHD